jgi:hypothetical protein
MKLIFLSYNLEMFLSLEKQNNNETTTRFLGVATIQKYLFEE